MNKQKQISIDKRVALLKKEMFKVGMLPHNGWPIFVRQCLKSMNAHTFRAALNEFKKELNK